MVGAAFVVRPGDEVARDVLGGKAGALWHLAEAGFPVPRFAVVTTDAYRLVADDAAVRTVLDALPADAPDETVCELVDHAFLTATMPDGLRDAIVAAAQAVAGSGGALAVRSSATAEDLRGASFAGQYRSFLDVQADDHAVDAVRRTWASLWYPAAKRYRVEHGIHDTTDAHGPSMAVVLMQLVTPRLAGVAFTVDPAGDERHVRIETVSGFADRLVSGEATPEVTLIERSTIVDHTSVDRTIVDHTSIDATGDRMPDPDVMREVAALALRAEATFGCPQDVEWVWDGEVQLVQSRPVTVFGSADDDGFDTDTRRSTFTTAGIAEMLPGFLPPLVWDTFGRAVDEAFLTLFADLGALPSDADGALVRVRGQAALDVDLLVAVAERLPGVSPDALVQQLLGGETDRVEHAGARLGGVRTTRRSRLAHDVRVARLQRRAVGQGDVIALTVDRVLDRVLDHAPIHASLDDIDLLAYRARLVDLLGRATQAEVEVAAAAAASYERLVGFLASYLPDDADELAGLATRRDHSSGAIRAWSDCARALRRSSIGRRALRTDDVAAAMALLRTTDDHSLIDTFEHTAWRAGSRSVAVGPTWAEDLGAAWRMVAASAARRHGGNGRIGVDELRSRLVATRRWRRIRLLTGAVLDSQSVLLRRRVNEATDLLARRETLKSTLLTLGGEIRRVHLELGRRLAEGGRLDRPDDVDLLGADELGAALRGGGPDRVELLRRHRRGEQAAAAVLPLRFVGRPETGAVTVPNGDHFQGWAASPGIYEGTARVVGASSDHLERDEVLVARTTDPSWGPLFLTAGALVIEQGGPLSHAAVVARELGVPAVVNVPGIMARVRTGDRLLVDGTRGTVVVEAPDDASGTGGDPADHLRDEGVFVPAVMGAGLVFSIIVLVRDWFDRVLGGDRREANAAAQSRLLAHHVLHGDDAPDGDDDLARRRRILGTLAGVLLGVAAYLVPGAVANYFRPGGYLAEIGWVLAVTAVLVAGSITLGTVLAASALHPEHPSPTAVRALRMSEATMNTHLFSEEPRHHDWGHRWHGTASIALLVTTVATGVLTLAVEMDSPGLLERDVRWLRSLRSDDPSMWFDIAEWFGRFGVTAAVAVVLAAMLWRRHRRLSLVLPLAVLATFGITALFTVVVDRTGPAGTIATAGRPTYPNGIAAQSTVLVVMLAVAVTQATRRRSVGASAGIALAAVAVVADIGLVVRGDAWPSDVFGGVLVGLLVASIAVLVAVDGRIEHGARHSLLVVPERLALWAGRLAGVWVVVALVVFVALSLTVGIPDNPYASLGVPALRRTVQIASLVFVGISALVARRWRATGATMLAVTGVLMAVVAAIEYPPSVALAVAVTFLLPAFGHWLAWQHGRPLRSLVAPAVVCAVLVTGTWVGATTVYDTYFGPTHPESSLASFSTDRVLWAWAGGLGDHTVTVNARLRHDDPAGTASIRLVAEGTPTEIIEPASIIRTGRTLSVTFDSLEADTVYHYAVVVGGRADLSGTVRTAPSGAASFTVTFGSCARTASNGMVYEAIAAQHPLLHIITGDFHYGDVSTDDPDRLRAVLDSTIGAPAQQALYLSTAVAYVWDDHDYGGNDSDADSAARTMAEAVYREYVPHVPLPSDEGIQQAFTIGRIRFVVTDLRSYRHPAPDGSGQMMGDEELAWFEQELISARDAGQVVVWVNPTPWIGGEAPGSDTWAGFPEQRRQISDFLAAEDIHRILMLSGDAHMIAIDDGTNSDYSTTGGAGFVVAHGSAFDRPGSRKGGPYSEGSFPGGGQFGVLQVVDDGGPTVSFVVSGRNWQDREVVRYEFTL